MEKSFAAAEAAAIPMIPSTFAIADGGDLGPLSARRKKRRMRMRTTMAIRVRSTFPPSQRMRRGIEPFVAGNDGRRNRMGGERKEGGREREDGTVPPIEEDIIMGRRESEVAKDERGKKESL